MDVFGEGHSNEVNTENMIGASPFQYFLIVYICVIRNWNNNALTVTFGCPLAHFCPPPISCNDLFWHHPGDPGCKDSSWHGNANIFIPKRKLSGRPKVDVLKSNLFPANQIHLQTGTPQSGAGATCTQRAACHCFNGRCMRTPAGSQIAAKELISQISLSFLELRDVDRKSVNSSQWQLHGFCIINYLYGARHSNYHPDEYDILIRQALILIALQHLTVSAGLA